MGPRVDVLEFLTFEGRCLGRLEEALWLSWTRGRDGRGSDDGLSQFGGASLDRLKEVSRLSWTKGRDGRVLAHWPWSGSSRLRPLMD